MQREDHGPPDIQREDHGPPDIQREDQGPADRQRADQGPSDRQRVEQGPSDRQREDQGPADRQREDIYASFGLRADRIAPDEVSAQSEQSPEKSNIGELESHPESEMIIKELQNYILSLIMRPYTVVIIILFISFVFLILPIEFFILDKSLKLLARLEVYFVPVFWIAIDDQVFHFTVKKLKDIYLKAKLLFY